MTRPAHRKSAAWLVAPLAAGSLAVSAGWTLHHDPFQAAAAPSATVEPALQRQAQRAARGLAASQVALGHLETAVHQRQMQMVRLDAYIRALRQVRGLGPAQGVAGGSAGAAAAPAPAAVPAPPPVVVPPTSTTTGAS